jgi:hypothetical protein
MSAAVIAGYVKSHLRLVLQPVNTECGGSGAHCPTAAAMALASIIRVRGLVTMSFRLNLAHFLCQIVSRRTKKLENEKRTGWVRIGLANNLLLFRCLYCGAECLNKQKKEPIQMLSGKDLSVLSLMC